MTSVRSNTWENKSTEVQDFETYFTAIHRPSRFKMGNIYMK